MNWVKIVRAWVGFGLAAAICVGVAPAAAGAAAAAPSAAGTSSRAPSGHRPGNSHVRAPAGATAAPTLRGTPSRARPGSVTVSRLRRHAPTAQRKAGFVSGTVRDAKGAAVAGAKVKLAKPNGRPIRAAKARHGTTTDSSGHYAMKNVKGGRYRVAAGKKGVGGGHATVSMKTGGAHRADVKLNGKAAKRKPAKSIKSL
jgi:hypothetical protein